MLEILDVVLGFGGGLLLSWLLHRNIPTPKPELIKEVQTITRVISPEPNREPNASGSDRVYVRFEFNDGRVDVRKFKATDLDLSLEWKGRRFEAGEWTPDGHIYREVVS